MTDPNRTFLDTAFQLLREMRKRYDAEAKAHDMTLSRARALQKIEENEGLTQTALAEALAIETPTLNRLLDKLETGGFVERRQLDGDKRVRCINLSDAGRPKAEEIRGFSSQLRDEVFAGVTAAETQAATRFIEKLLANLERGRS